MFANIYSYLLLSDELIQQVIVCADSMGLKNYLHLQESQISQWKSSTSTVSRREINGMEVSYLLSIVSFSESVIHHFRIISK